jgi:hypothetical protein
MAQLRRNFPSLGQNFRSKRCQRIAILLVTSKREHLATQSHESDTIPLVPPKHLRNIACIRKSQALHECLSPCDTSRLVSVRPIFGCMWRLIWIFQRVSILKDGCDATCSGAENRGIGETEVCAEASLIDALVSAGDTRGREK